MIFITVIYFSATADCQWYHRKYGVNDIFQLTPDQFKEALRRANGGVWTGAVISTIGVAGLVSGIAISSSAGHMGSEGEGRAYTGVFMIIGSVPLTLTGFTILGINGSRASKIKGILRVADVKLGLMNCIRQPMINYSFPEMGKLAAITITIYL